ncbi:MAG: hypothetical protein R3190_09225, partial [Thermoanaerobaculia bacterium]|nr:hypothetical protein [Thermoanaerobaculia bacterium]
WLRTYGVLEAWRSGDPQTARARLEEVTSTIDRESGALHEALVGNVGRLYLLLGLLDDGREWLRTRHADLDCSETWMLYAYAGRDREGLGRLRDGCAGLQNRLSLLAGSLLLHSGISPDQVSDLVDTRYPVPFRLAVYEAEADLARGETERAVAKLEDALRIGAGKPSPEVRAGDPAYFLAIQSLARAYEGLGRAERSRLLLARAVEVDNTVLGSTTGALWLETLALLADLERRHGDEAEAERLEDRLAELLVVADPDHPLVLEIGKRV